MGCVPATFRWGQRTTEYVRTAQERPNKISQISSKSLETRACLQLDCSSGMAIMLPRSTSRLISTTSCEISRNCSGRTRSLASGSFFRYMLLQCNSRVWQLTDILQSMWGLSWSLIRSPSLVYRVRQQQSTKNKFKNKTLIKSRNLQHLSFHI
jgi:hypothetical protein